MDKDKIKELLDDDEGVLDDEKAFAEKMNDPKFALAALLTVILAETAAANGRCICGKPLGHPEEGDEKAPEAVPVNRRGPETWN